MAISTAVGLDRVSKTVGYKLKKGQFQKSSPNLPQRIYILGQGNLANQATMPILKREITSANEAGNLYGFGSPIHQIMRILRPLSGDGVGGIPTIVFPQADANGATQTVITKDLTLSANATDSSTHYIVINGRNNIDGTPYAYSVVKDDTKAAILTKIAAAINAVVSSPVIASVANSKLVLTTKWAGATSAETNAYFVTGDKTCGITYSETSKVDGTGAVVITDAMTALSSEWNTLVINPYGTATFDAIEAINGIPDPDSPTGRYSGTSFLPFISIWGSVEDDKDDLIAITDASARKSQVTHALAPAPLSKGTSWEAAANMAYLVAIINQNSPHLDVNSKQYPDMPIPADELIGDMSDYNNRDFLVKKGCSTVELKNGKYTVVDFITTYHPDGELNPTYQYCRNLNVYWNLVYGLKLIDANFIVDNAIVSNDQSVNVADVIKPKEVIQLTRSYADDLGQRALISEVDFMKDSILCDISSTNPNRLDRFFRVKISGIARIVSTDLEVGFAFGS